MAKGSAILLISLDFSGRSLCKLRIANFKTANFFVGRLALIDSVDKLLKGLLHILDFLFPCILQVRKDLRLNNSFGFPN